MFVLRSVWYEWEKIWEMMFVTLYTKLSVVTPCCEVSSSASLHAIIFSTLYGSLASIAKTKRLRSCLFPPGQEEFCDPSWWHVGPVSLPVRLTFTLTTHTSASSLWRNKISRIEKILLLTNFSSVFSPIP